MKIKTEQQRAEAVRLGNRLLAILAFIEGVQDFPIGSQFRALVHELVTAANVRGLKIMARDVDAMAITLTPDERMELSAVLAASLNVDLDAEWMSQEVEMMRIVAKGRISSEKERQRLERFEEALEFRAAPASQLAAVRAVLKSG
jgi:hypothetical protein